MNIVTHFCTDTLKDLAELVFVHQMTAESLRVSLRDIELEVEKAAEVYVRIDVAID